MNIQTSYDPTVPLLEHNRNAQVYLSKDGFKTLQSSKFMLKKGSSRGPSLHKRGCWGPEISSNLLKANQLMLLLGFPSTGMHSDSHVGLRNTNFK